jgi:hypothetical protein
MKIGFDLDGIFIDKPLFVPKIIIERLFREKTNSKIAYRFPSRFEQAVRILSHSSALRPTIIQNVIYLKTIVQKSTHKHYLISGRFGFLKERTNAIVKKYNFDKIFDSMHFNFEDQQPHIFKDEVIKEMKIDRYIDDDLPLLEFLAVKNPKVKFFWLNNKQNKPMSENLFAIKNLFEMFL